MSLIESIYFEPPNIKKIENWKHRICLVVSGDNTDWSNILQIDNLIYASLKRCLESNEFKKLFNGESLTFSFPEGLRATEFQVIKVQKQDDFHNCRLVGGAVASYKSQAPILLITEKIANTPQILYGLLLKDYKFNNYKKRDRAARSRVVIVNSDFQKIKKDFEFFEALLRGVYFCRDLTNEPANILNTLEFSKRLKFLEVHGVKVEILEKKVLEKKGFRALLAVGQGSDCPSLVIVLRWEGSNKNDKPLLLLGKGVVFDSGGISLKPAGGMEEMVMDMGGAGVVAGTMQSLALRKASANVTAIIGLVENMPDGKAQRPGDVIKTMKGDTVEVVNTDAEGRLVLSDLLWFSQTEFVPKAIIDVATLTGAIIVALGYQNAGVFSNDDDFCEKFLLSAKFEGEGAWRLPLSSEYKKNA